MAELPSVPFDLSLRTQVIALIGRQAKHSGAFRTGYSQAVLDVMILLDEHDPAILQDRCICHETPPENTAYRQP